MKKRYERPVILKNVGGFSNKFGMDQRLKVYDQVDGVAIDQLIKEYGSPLFVFSEKTIRNRFRRFNHAFKEFYPKTRFGWSYKTNYLKSVAAIFHQEGALGEVVSGFEYQKARNLGVEGRDILFNGPFKKREALITAIQEDAKIHIDHFDELITLEKLSEELKIIPQVAIRVNMDTGIYPQWSRFGFNYENGEAERAMVRILTRKQLKLVGLHTHLGTFILTPEPYRRALEKLLALYRIAQDQHQHTIEYIDLGGGFPSMNKLKAQYLPTSVTVPSIEQYAEQITGYLNEQFPGDDGPWLYLESGRALIDEAGYLITTVHATKRLPDQRRALILDGGVNLLFTAFFYDHNIYPAKEYHGTMEPTVLYGPLCMNIDLIRESISLPYITPGDQLVIHPVGAYGVTQWMQFIQMRPAVVMVDEKRGVHRIRRAETIEDVEGAELLPEHLILFEEVE